VADVRPFRAVRYAGPDVSQTAPPYDVVDDRAAAELRSRDPHNIVHLTLEPDADMAGERFRSWLSEGVLVRDEVPAVWWLEQDFVGPDGVALSRAGIVASLRAEPYETGAVLPHERTHAGPIEGRLRLLRATRAQLEPIFLLYDRPPPLTRPGGPPGLEVEGTRLWRIDGDSGAAGFFADVQLLIADGHHRYETAVAFAAEDGADRLLAVLVSTSDPGLEIFPTHRLFRGHDIALPGNGNGSAATTTQSALRRLAELPYDRSHAVAYRPGAAVPLEGEPGELDVELAERLVGHEGLGYTADAAEAVARVDAGEYDGALLLRATRIEDVFERARRGEVMPQKTTYFFPKLTSGLLLYPLD
jgi:uncharacterized protein (DUF1015 family)